MIGILKDRFSMYKNFEIIKQDVLKVDLNSLIKENNFKTTKIVANLPYYITTPIMIQKEVADRLTAIPGEKNSGAITHAVYYYATSEEILTVPNTSFIPEPEVESEVIKLTLRKEPYIKISNQKKFFELIKVAFMQRRKTLLNAVSNSSIDISKEKMEKVLQELEINSKIRGEALTIEQFAAISERIWKILVFMPYTLTFYEKKYNILLLKMKLELLKEVVWGGKLWEKLLLLHLEKVE